jgi:hypothetical protein
MVSRRLDGCASGSRARGTEPGKDEARQPDQERGDAVLDVVVARPRLVARQPRGQRLRRLDPVDDCEHDQRETDEDGKPHEKTAPLHAQSLRTLCDGRRNT